MPVNRRCARIQPQPRRVRRFCNRPPHDSRAKDARVLDLAPVLRIVAAVHAPSREIDDHIGAFNRLCPFAKLLRIPAQRSPLGGLGMSRDHGYFVILLMEMPRQNVSNLACASRNDNAKWAQGHALGAFLSIVPRFANGPKFASGKQKAPGQMPGAAKCLGISALKR